MLEHMQHVHHLLFFVRFVAHIGQNNQARFVRGGWHGDQVFRFVAGILVEIVADCTPFNAATAVSAGKKIRPREGARRRPV